MTGERGTLVAELYRWARDRCAHCGHRFHWSGDPRRTTGYRDGLVFHGPCLDLLTWRDAAEDRLAVLALVVELADVDARTVSTAAEGRALSPAVSTREGNRVRRVFRDLSGDAR